VLPLGRGATQLATVLCDLVDNDGTLPIEFIVSVIQYQGPSERRVTGSCAMIHSTILGAHAHPDFVMRGEIVANFYTATIDAWIDV
jgi:hypothetical protein